MKSFFSIVTSKVKSVAQDATKLTNALITLQLLFTLAIIVALALV